MVYSVINGYWAVVPFLMLFAAGFLYTGAQSILVRHRANRNAIENAKILPVTEPEAQKALA